MRQRRWIFRSLGAVCLALSALLATIALAGGGLFPRNASPFLSRKENSGGEAADYYSAMSAPATLAAWKTAYFPTSGNNRASANYYNAGDLGFGREMHCYEETAFTACYVANHGLGAAAPAEISVQDAVGNTRNLPTVAMVFDYATYLAAQPNVVRFYVYDTSGNLTTQVGLDSEGDKSVPGLCLACHGGNYDSGTNKVTGANFLPWDLDSFVYSPTPGSTRADQTEQFRILNAMVRNAFPDAKINALLDGWYGGVGAVFNSNAVFNGDYIPPAYSAPVDQVLYTTVVKPYCRGCHMAQGFDLETPGQVDGAAFYPVFVSRDMPHAQLANHRFWSSTGPFYLARRFAGTSTFVVTKTQDTNDGTCDGDCSLREAVAAANASADYSVIVFEAPGTFALTRNGIDDTNVNGDLDLLTDMTILGNSIQATILSGNNADRVLHIKNGAEVLIQNVQITGGNSNVGAGLRVSGSGTVLILNHSVVQDNQASLDGAGLSAEEGADVEVHQSAFFFNDALGHGGAVFVDLSTVTLYDTTLANNSADLGGAVFTGNGSSTSLDYVTAILNTATTTGRALLTFDGSATSVRRSIVGGNLGGGSECYADVGTFAAHYSNGYNRFGQNGGAGGCPNTGTGDQVIAGPIESVVRLQIDIDPAQGVWGLYPVAGGPAVDAIPVGGDCSTPAYDAFNHARPRDADNNGSIRCDIGALEFLTTPVYLPLILR